MNRAAPSQTRRRDAVAFFALSMLGAGSVAGCGSVAGSGARSVARGYSDSLQSALEPYTDRLAGYHYRSTPIGGFGVGSIYLGAVRGADLSHAESGWYLGDPQSWLATGLPQSARLTWHDRVISEASFGAFQLDAQRQRAIEANLGASVFIALGVDASLDFERGATVSFKAGEVRNRRLNWAGFASALAAGVIAKEVADAIRKDDFIIAAADVVLIDYRAEVAVDESINPSLGASLRAKSLQLRPKELNGVGASLAVREATHGHFVAASSQPVVAAVLFKRPPPRPKDGSAPRTDPSSWPPADVSDSALDAVQSRVLQGAR